MPPPDSRTTTRIDRLTEALERARSGDSSGLDDIVVECTPLLWHVARSQGVRPDDVADVVQHTWLELVARLADIRTPSTLTAWLITTTKRESWRLGRKRGTTTELDAIGEPSADLPEVDEALLTEERDRVLWRVFARLPDRCRQLLRIVAMVDRPTYEVIGEALGMPHGSIGPTRGRCLAKLRSMLLAEAGLEA
ncbi:MAG TPA: sigma-70 family RNA polymerase sigma factor [Microlunatus sp.]